MRKSKKNSENTPRKRSLSGLFYNDRFVMIFSVFAAVILWFFVAASDKDSDTGKTIQDIAIQVALSDSAKEDGLQIFSNVADIKASVTIKGNWLTIGSVTKDDIQVVAKQVNTIDQPGTYSLQLTAKSQGIRTNYEIVQESLEPQTVTVKVDRLKEKEFTIEENIQYKTEAGYIGTLDNFNPSKVTISGPERDMANIARVVAEYKTEDTLKESQTITANLVLYDSDGQRIPDSELEYIVYDKSTQVDLNILKKIEVPVKATFTNKPAGFNDSLVTVSPSTIEVGCPEKLIDEFTQVELEPIDFSKLTLSNTEITLPIELPAGCKNLSNAYNATVSFNLSDYSTKAIEIPDSMFTFSGVPEDKEAASVAKSITVTVIGPSSQLAELTPESISVEINMKEKESQEGHFEMPVTITVKGATGSWVTGEKRIIVKMEKKTE